MSMMVVNKVYFNLSIKSRIKYDQHTYNILVARYCKVYMSRCVYVKVDSFFYIKIYIFTLFSPVE